MFNRFKMTKAALGQARAAFSWDAHNYALDLEKSSRNFLDSTVENAKLYEAKTLAKGSAAKAAALQFAGNHPYMMATAGIMGAAGIGGLGAYSAYNMLNDN